MDLSPLMIVWILISWPSTCKSEVNCVPGNGGMSMCCFRYSATTAEIFNIKCPNTNRSIEIIDVVHLYGVSMCDDVGTHTCNISRNNIVWRSHSKTYLTDETCLNTTKECRFEIAPITADNSCNDAVVSAEWSNAVMLTFYCNGGLDVEIPTTVTTSATFISANVGDKTTKENEMITSEITTINLPIVETTMSSSSHDYPVSYSSAMRSVSNTASTTPASQGNRTYPPQPTEEQSSAAGAIGGGIAAVVVVIIIVIIILFLVRRRKLQEEAENKSHFDDAKSNTNGHTYIDIDSTKTKSHNSQYEEVYATQEKDSTQKHCDSHETSHYCYAGRNECLGKGRTKKGHTNDKDQKLYDNPGYTSAEGEEKPQYDNVDNLTYDTPKNNRVDSQDLNHYDNINEEVENENNEKIDLYAVPNKAKTGVSGDKNKMSLKRNMDGSDYSIYPTLPAKCFETLAEDPDRPKYAEIDMEKSGISASLRKNVDTKPSEDLNYAQIQF